MPARAYVELYVECYGGTLPPGLTRAGVAAALSLSARSGVPRRAEREVVGPVVYFAPRFGGAATPRLPAPFLRKVNTAWRHRGELAACERRWGQGQQQGQAPATDEHR